MCITYFKKVQICFAATCLLGLGLLGILFLNSTATMAQTGNGPARTVSLLQAYHHVFAHVGYLNEAARKAEGQGADATSHRVLYRNVAKLTPTQAAALDRVAVVTVYVIDCAPGCANE